jgi:hypothetical protein
MNLAIIGSRNFTDEKLFKEKIIPILAHLEEEVVIISGGAKGADTLAENYANQNNLKMIVIKPDWKKYGRGAGIVRNTEIINQSDMVIAFWDGQSKGTKDSVSKAKKLGKVVHVIKLEEKSNHFN